ncbi:N-acetyltransferase [Micromonospora sp. D75]|uniref:GNAT family N-acetyltransferase n=1 Tax=Micromonospora sp. D75 TaxID=2824885 RepID=UPI001B392EF7|nr:GNAT family N-acetyltransferase [Micromonospora sp. D75]MBQ1065424.1 GNAT family N-acetyltransferase [Micromonospora sp. D75]
MLHAVTGPEITVATPEDRGSVVTSLVAAFTKDPVLRHLFPDEATYARYAAAFFGHLFDKRVHKETIWTIGHGASVAIWEPPASGSAQPDDDLAARLPADVLHRVRAYDEAVHAALPAAPFWYLGVLGTHPDHAGRRWGHAVMRMGLDRAAADGLPAILETSNPDNVEVYRRAGWEVVHAFAEPLPTWVMRNRRT